MRNIKSSIVTTVAVMLICFGLATPQAFGGNPVNFVAPVTYDSGAAGANSVVWADVNFDGYPDAIIATNNGVSVLLNNEDGTFLPSVTYATGGVMSNAVAVVDVNGDGNPDIIVTNECLEGDTNCHGVAVLFGNGDGTFQSAVGYNSGGYETGAIAIGDVNGDGAPDLILTSNCQQYTCAGGTLTLLLNNGDGTFAKAIALDATDGGPVAVGDVNGDGKLDLVTAGGVLLGNGDGTFTALTSDIVSGGISIALADVNGDNILDAIVVDATGVGVQLGNGDGTFQNAHNYKTGGYYPLFVTVADFNGDNKLDLAVANECSAVTKGVCSANGTVGVLAGNGDGTFQKAVTFRSGGWLTTSVTATDADQDGKLDLWVTNACTTAYSTCSPTGSVAVLINNFLTNTSIKVTTSLTPTIINQPATFTATVTGGSGVPDGSPITFTGPSGVIGTVGTTNGIASVTASFPQSGYQTVLADYGGDLYHNPSEGKVTEVVNPAPSSVAITLGPSATDYGQNVAITAVVTGSNGAATPTGKVAFYNGATYLGTVTLDGTGTATENKTTLPVGSDVITANYNGDSQNAKSTGGGVTETVNPAQITLTLSSSLNPLTAGKLVRFTATFTSDGTTPTGPVTFSYNGATLGTANIVAGKANFSTTTLPQGADVVTATYAGTSNYGPATGSISQQVN